jgi:lysozyme family protein
MSFEDAFQALLVYEGDYSNDARDPGGETRYGITEAVARRYGYQGDMKALSLTTAQEIYRKHYWARLRLDELPPMLRYPMFDAAVHSGPGQSARWLQRAVGVADDGIIGPVTLEATRQRPVEWTRASILSQRLDFLTRLTGWDTYGKGWAARLACILRI